MTRAYLEIKKFDAQYTKYLKETLNKATYEHHFKYRDDDKMRVVFRFVRFHAASVDNFRKLLTEAARACGVNLSDSHFTGMPIITLNKEANTLDVYPNILLSESKIEFMKYCSGFIYSRVVEDILKKYEEEREDSAKGKKWATISRVWKQIKRKEVMGTGAVLTRYLKLSEVSEKKIAEIAIELAALREPVKLLYAETHEDMIRMYSASGVSSCMVPHPDRPWSTMLRLNRHPCSLYVEHPYTRGCYMIRGGKVVARTILYLNEKDKEEYGRVFASVGKYSTLFTTALQEAGYKVLQDAFKRQVTFEVPGLEWEGQIILPFPYMDNMASSVHVGYNPTTKRFTIDCANPNKKANVNVQMGGGYVRATDLRQKICGHCHQSFNTTGIQTVDGHLYCDNECACLEGYRDARRADNTLVWVRASEIVEDCYTGNRYTNLEAAKMQNCFPFVEFIEDEIDEERVSRDGVLVQHGENVIRLHRAGWGKLEGEFEMYKVSSIRGEYIWAKKISKEKLELPKIAVHLQASVDLANHQLFA